MTTHKIRRNDPCSCFSGKKYKQCCYGRSVISAQPAAAGEINGLLLEGLAAHQAGDPATAASRYHRMLALAPDHSDALHLLGLIDFQNGDNLSALSRIEAAIHQSRHDPRYFYNLGTVLMQLKRPHDAIVQFKIATGMDPANAQVLGNLGAALRETGERNAAIDCFRAALLLQPDDPNSWANLCVTLIEEERTEEGADCLQRALALDPQDANALHNIGFALQKTGNPNAAAASFARALGLEPRNVKTLINLGSLLMSYPMLDEPDLAVECFREAVAIDPENNVNHSSLLMAMQYSSNLDVDELIAHHRCFSQQFELPLRKTLRPHQNDRNPARRLKIGYVSADLYNHAVATFIEPILQGHDRSMFDITCYYNNDKRDWMAERLQSQADHWVQCKHWSDEKLAARIYNDGIDILIDLGGHSADNRMLTFARKPAPIQASWIGYPGTTGLQGMDYYIGDRYFLSRDAIAAQFSEKLVRIAAACTFRPVPDAPEIGELPGASNGFITFGSFNQPHKFGGSVIQSWVKILHAVPEARMFLAGLPDTTDGSDIALQFSRLGIDPQRLKFHKRCSVDQYLALHRKVDLCLDTFPYAGGTTTMHAAWMGVPTLTFAGATAASRQGCVIPGHLNLENMVAENIDEFVSLGIRWSKELPRLAALRTEMRERFTQSAIMRPGCVTRSLENALRQMWSLHCAGQAPSELDVVS